MKIFFKKYFSIFFTWQFYLDTFCIQKFIFLIYFIFLASPNWLHSKEIKKNNLEFIYVSEGATITNEEEVISVAKPSAPQKKRTQKSENSFLSEKNKKNTISKKRVNPIKFYPKKTWVSDSNKKSSENITISNIDSFKTITTKQNYFSKNINLNEDLIFVKLYFEKTENIFYIFYKPKNKKYYPFTRPPPAFLA